MELEWLRTFLAVVDYGGFAAASEHIHRSQSRVSAHIAALERDLKVTLLDRSQRPVALTHAGTTFANYARDILARVSTARSAVAVLRGLVSGDIALLTTPCIGASFVPTLLTRFKQRYPCIKIQLLERARQDLDQALATPSIALALRPTRPQPATPELRHQVLWQEALKLVIPPDHPLASTTEPVQLDALVNETTIVVGPDGRGESETAQLLAREGIWPPIDYTVDAPQTLIALVRASLGIGIINSLALDICTTGGTAIVDIQPPGLVREVGLYWHDVLLETDVGRALHHTILTTPRPAPGGALPRLAEALEEPEPAPPVPAREALVVAGDRLSRRGSGSRSPPG